MYFLTLISSIFLYLTESIKSKEIKLFINEIIIIYKLFYKNQTLYYSYKIFYRNYIIIIHENILENLREFQRNENI